MRCQYCGNQISPGQRFCDRCGEQVSGQNSRYYNNAWGNAEYEGDYGYGEAAYRQPGGRTASAVVIGVVIGICCLLLGLFGFFLLKGHDNEADAAVTQPTTTTESADTQKQEDAGTNVDVDKVDVNYNLNNGGGTTRVERVYYYDPYFYSSDAELYAPGAPDFFCDSSCRYLQDYEVCYLDDDQLQRAINDIYARNGLIFKTDRYQDYYDSQCWYYGWTHSQEEAKAGMNDYEISNIELLVSYQ